MHRSSAHGPWRQIDTGHRARAAASGRRLRLRGLQSCPAPRQLRARSPPSTFRATRTPLSLAAYRSTAPACAVAGSVAAWFIGSATARASHHAFTTDRPPTCCYRCPSTVQPVSPPEAQPIWPGPNTAWPGPNRARAGPAHYPCPGLGRHPSPWAGTARYGVSRPAR